MVQKSDLIRVGFVIKVSKDWLGGFNYFKNLFFAISVLDNPKIIPIIFICDSADNELIKVLEQYALIVRHPILVRGNIFWLFRKVIEKIIKKDILLEWLLRKYEISVLSHSAITTVGSCLTVNWIPDFQHLHLNDMFSYDEIAERNRAFMRLAKKSDIILLSSNDAYKDFKEFAPLFENKGKVLQFVSQPPGFYKDLNSSDEKKIRAKYGLEGDFYYLPNQYWKHKNHLLVLKAVKLLQKKGFSVNIICTGYTVDYRDGNHFSDLKRFIEHNELGDRVKLFGLVDLYDVYCLITFSKAVINPSLFEGWSSTVEECKSVGKGMILSDINVHKEQYPEAAFFHRYSEESLSDCIENYKELTTSKYFMEHKLRTKEFACSYEKIVVDLVSD